MVAHVSIGTNPLTSQVHMTFRFKFAKLSHASNGMVLHYPTCCYKKGAIKIIISHIMMSIKIMLDPQRILHSPSLKGDISNENTEKHSKHSNM